jgi:hypothetical protein
VEVVMEQIKVASGKLKSTIKNLIKEGNVRRIIVRNATGRTLIDMPLSAGLAGIYLAPLWAAGLASWRWQPISRSSLNVIRIPASRK